MTRSLVLKGVGLWIALVLLGLVQLALFGEDWTRGYLDFLALAAAGLLAWRIWR